MHPVIHIGIIAVPSYGLFVALGFAIAFWTKRRESRRLGFTQEPGYRWVGFGALAGAVVGSKLGMLLYVSPTEWLELLADLARFELGGKTMIGALAGGYLGVELTKKQVGITHSTGDAFAVAIPLGQAFGRIGCFLGGCCYGASSGLPWSVVTHDAARHPVQLYEALLDITLALALFAMREEPRPSGHLFRYCLIGYACIRLVLDPLRGDQRQTWFAMSAVQIFCAVAVGVLALSLLRKPRGAYV